MFVKEAYTVLPNRSLLPGCCGGAQSLFPLQATCSAVDPESMRPSCSHTLSPLLLCRWWSSTPRRSFCLMTVQGSTPCLLLQRTRWLSRAEPPIVLSSSEHCRSLPVLLKRRLSQFYLTHSNSGVAVCFTFKESHILIIVFIPYSLKWNLVFVLNCTLKRFREPLL